ncbi:hypothetical protein GCM10018791_53670 [Streptomyces zaomyceticus]|nr:hypothetical protein GCM10018791_53670 [Streptomyces zaomyceticus]
MATTPVNEAVAIMRIDRRRRKGSERWVRLDIEPPWPHEFKGDPGTRVPPRLTPRSTRVNHARTSDICRPNDGEATDRGGATAAACARAVLRRSPVAEGAVRVRDRIRSRAASAVSR